MSIKSKSRGDRFPPRQIGMGFLYKGPDHDEPYSCTRPNTTYWSLVGIPNNQEKADVTYVTYSYIDPATADVAGTPCRVTPCRVTPCRVAAIGARGVGGCRGASRRAQGLPKAWSCASRARAIPKSLAICALRCSSSSWRRRASRSESWKALK